MMVDRLWPDPIPIQCPVCYRHTELLGIRYRTSDLGGWEGYMIKDPDTAVAFIMACLCRVPPSLYVMHMELGKPPEFRLVDRRETR